MFRSEVLSLYRRIFRLARQWQATTAAESEAERQYIRDEARKLFHKNKKVSVSIHSLLIPVKLIIGAKHNTIFFALS